MLVAPLLSPILSLGMSITVASRRSLGWIIPTLFKSALLVSAIALVVSFLFRDGNSQVLLLRLEPNLNLFLIAFAAGAGAAYAWVKPNLIAVIPGIAIAVSLLPPLAAAGIGMETLSKSLLADAATLFLINLGGIVLASVVVFLLFGFAPLQKETEKIILAEEKGAEVAGK
jgi:uncharacterized membrane protein